MTKVHNEIAFILFIFAVVSIALCLSGCKATETIAEGVAAKTISADGMFTYSRVGLDEKTQTPELLSIFVWGDYTSVVPGDEVFRYEEVEDASVFNADAKTKKKKVFFATGDKERMDKVIEKMGGKYEGNIK
jgi:hypothetical protein